MQQSQAIISQSNTKPALVVLDAAALKQVAGGVQAAGPNGGWSLASGPNGGWSSTTAAGPNGGW
jgi:hypothetical protein